jgi:hypothetical protein
VTPGVDFFRVDRSGTTKRRLAIAGVLVAVGSTTVGAHLVRRLDAVNHLVSLAGGATMLAGLVLGFGTMALMLFENVWLSIRESGLLVHENGQETTIAWEDLQSASADESGFVVIARRSEGAVRWYAGNGARDVAQRIEEARRKAAHGLLREQAS